MRSDCHLIAKYERLISIHLKWWLAREMESIDLISLWLIFNVARCLSGVKLGEKPKAYTCQLRVVTACG